MAQGESTPDTKTTELTVPRDVSGLDRDEAARLIAGFRRGSRVPMKNITGRMRRRSAMPHMTG